MALKLKKPSSKPKDQDDEPSFNPPNNSCGITPAVKLGGRRFPPPPLGSGFSEFLDWSSDESLCPTPEQEILAFNLWIGIDIEDVNPDPTSSIKM
jgi:hypothetical protein